MQTLVIGRDSTNQIVLDVNFVSRKHAQLVILDSGQVLIKDLNSTNGTFVNGNRITEAYLRAGDVVKCGNAFLNWTQYVAGDPVFSAGSGSSSFQYSMENTMIDAQSFDYGYHQKVTLGLSFKYLTTKIYDIGDLFKTEENRLVPTLFFFFFQAPFTLAFLLFMYFKSGGGNIGNVVLLPFFASLLIFGVSQFLTFELLSIKRKTDFSKILFASSIFSFLQSIPYLLYLITCAIFILGMNSHNDFGFNVLDKNVLGAGYFFFYTFLLCLCALTFVSAVLFLYRYFRTINVPSGIGINFVIITFFLNTLFQGAFIYVMMLIIRGNLL
jgi:hypothetical protein